MEELFVEYWNKQTNVRAVTTAQGVTQSGVWTFEVRHELEGVEWTIDLEPGDELLIQRAS